MRAATSPRRPAARPLITQERKEVPERDERSVGDTGSRSTEALVQIVTSTDSQSYIVDLYSVENQSQPLCKPFHQKVAIHSNNEARKKIYVDALFDEGAMASVMSAAVYYNCHRELGGWSKSRCTLRMADGTLVPSIARWDGTISLGGIEKKGRFEVFDSKGAWSFLFGKPLLQIFKAVHDYEYDTVTLKLPGQQDGIELHNTLLTPIAKKRVATALGPPPGLVANPSMTPAGTRSGDFAATDAPRMTRAALDWGVRAPESSPTRAVLKIDSPRLLNFDQPLTSALTRTNERRDEEENEEFWDADEGEECADGAATIDNGSTHEKIIGGPSPPSREVSDHKQSLAHNSVPDSDTPAETVLQIEDYWDGDDGEKVTATTDNGYALGTLIGGSSPPSRKVPVIQRTLSEQTVPDTHPFAVHIRNAYAVVDGEDLEEDGIEVPTEALGQESIFCRATEPFRADRVKRILKEVQIGDDLTVEQRAQVDSMIREYADCFALSVSEVTPIPGAEHRLNIPPGKVFPLIVHQRRLTPPQREYINEKINEMLAADIIEPCDPSHVKCASPTTLAQKAHANGGLNRDELLHRINDQCVAANLPPLSDLPERPPAQETTGSKPAPKWRICQNYGALNKATEIAPMPQGDIRAKQQALSGHRWVSTFDFASGFYAIPVAEESKPYTCFYVEGRGYFQYKRMPFGLTGAPATFSHYTAQHLGDLTTDNTMELFVDDGATAGDVFEIKMANLRRILQRVRERGLSLSAAKSAFFMETIVFAGANVGPAGVSPDLAKLTAIVNWQQPKTAEALVSFLGLTSHFRDLIQGYALVEGPLRTLASQVQLPKNFTKSQWRSAHRNFLLDKRWTIAHTRAFLTLKQLLTSEPVLRCPKWDGTPFIITSDGCKEGFGAVLTQRFETKIKGKTVSRLHPIGFASKRTSSSEQNYKPFLLEFAALKYAFDKFNDIIYGFPVEIETDCQALRDVIASDRLSPAHARWRDAVVAHNITDVRHVPGKINVVADGISRKDEEYPRTANDGSAWSVQPDWETAHGLEHDIMLATAEDADVISKLQYRFAKEPFFLEIISAIYDMDPNTGKTPQQQRRAAHRAAEYFIDDGQLWRLGGATTSRARSRSCCVTWDEAKQMAADNHANNGHWGRDSVKLQLLDKITRPKLDEIILEALRECSQCKNFGTTHLHALLDPITRRHPLEGVAGDYISLPTSGGGITTLGVYLDIYSQYVWVFPYAKAPTGTDTVNALRHIGQMFAAPETFISDGGSHFNNYEVRKFCESTGTKAHVVSSYAPWINGLVEGTNKLLIHILKRLCAPNLDDNEYTQKEIDQLHKKWFKHLPEAVRCLNNRLLPAFNFSPKELLFGLVINTPKTPLAFATSALHINDVNTQLAYSAQQRLDGYDAMVLHALKRKETFDKRVLSRAPREVNFTRGQLVQIFRNELDNTFATKRKILPRWNGPYMIVRCTGNSYIIQTLYGKQEPGTFHARRLRAYHANPGSALETKWEAAKPALEAKERQREEEEAVGIEREREKEGEKDEEGQ